MSNNFLLVFKQYLKHILKHNIKAKFCVISFIWDLKKPNSQKQVKWWLSRTVGQGTEDTSIKWYRLPVTHWKRPWYLKRSKAIGVGGGRG